MSQLPLVLLLQRFPDLHVNSCSPAQHVTRASPGVAVLGRAFLVHIEPSRTMQVCRKSEQGFLPSCYFCLQMNV